MPYLVLAVGLVIGLYALYRFFINANVDQIKALFLTTILVVIALALFYLAITGRLAAALGLLAAMVPFGISYIRSKYGPKDTPGDDNQAPGGPMTHAEALDILGLEEGAEAKDVQKAFKKLMQKVHPDNEGSDWMAAKLNQARDILLGQDAPKD